MQFSEEQLQRRTRATHASHVADLHGPLRSHIAIRYGVVGHSVLNECRFFHIVDGLVPDIMHDMLEGGAQFTLKCLLQYLIYEKKYFSLKTLNERLLSFKYGHADIRNKPSEIAKSPLVNFDKLRQSGGSLLSVLHVHLHFPPYYSLTNLVPCEIFPSFGWRFDPRR